MFINRISKISKCVTHAGVVHIFRSRRSVDYFSRYQRYDPEELDQPMVEDLLGTPLKNKACRLVFRPNVSASCNEKPYWFGHVWDEKSMRKRCPRLPETYFILMMGSLVPATYQRNPGLGIFHKFSHAISRALTTVACWQAPYPFFVAITQVGVGEKTNFNILHRPFGPWNLEDEQARIRAVFGFAPK